MQLSEIKDSPLSQKWYANVVKWDKQIDDLLVCQQSAESSRLINGVITEAKWRIIHSRGGDNGGEWREDELCQ